MGKDCRGGKGTRDSAASRTEEYEDEDEEDSTDTTPEAVRGDVDAIGPTDEEECADDKGLSPKMESKDDKNEVEASEEDDTEPESPEESSDCSIFEEEEEEESDRRGARGGISSRNTGVETPSPSLDGGSDFWLKKRECFGKIEPRQKSMTKN